VGKDPFEGFGHLSPGAKFLRADLHLHSYGVSADVGDEGMTVEGIVAAAKDRGLDLVAITDHNAIDSVRPLLAAVEEEDLVAFAGVEVTTGQGHVLIYFAPEDVDAFASWFGKLEFKEDGASGDRYVLNQIHELLEEVRSAGGIAIPAHIGRDGTGFEARVSPQLKEAVICSPALAAVEVDDASEAEWYSASESGVEAEPRLELLRKREEALGDAGRRLAKLLFSDAHSLDRIGRDREGQERVTRVKMSEPTFASFKTALADPDARIKLEAKVPLKYPRIVGARLKGGFLDGAEIAFSANLTCLIGGRGAGKSTALESVNAVCRSQSGPFDAAGNSPDTVQLLYQDEVGALHHLKRDSGKMTYELSEGGAKETSIEIEGYGQDRVASIIRGYPDEPRPLLTFLDQFAALEEVERKLIELAERLGANAAATKPLAGAPKRKADAEKELEKTRLKLKALEESNLKEALKWRRKLQGERRLRAELEERLGEIGEAIESLDLSLDTEEMAARAEVDMEKTPSAELLNGDGEEEGLIATIAALGGELAAVRAEMKRKLAEAKSGLDGRLAEWKTREQAIEAKVQAVLEKLRAKGIDPKLAEMNRLTAAETAQLKTIAEAKTQSDELAEKTAVRRDLLKEYEGAQVRRGQLRSAAMVSLTKKLNGAFEDFQVKLDFRQGALVDIYAGWVRGQIGNQFFQNVRLRQFCETITPIELAAAVRRNDDSKLATLSDAEGVTFFADTGTVGQFIAALSGEKLWGLEEVARDDAPEITMTTFGEEVRTVRFESLSFGQKASILLGALLYSAEQTPLIIDQPEDHLDSQFIARTVVSVLRDVKESRQVIMATHNANITVLGDAEQIVPMQGWEGQGLIRQDEVGSVDALKTRARACEILEGGEAAYRRRGEMYGYEVKS
jgi:ABC-type cobalamin/Fe3+-siderophores transport system ATPase subunit